MARTGTRCSYILPIGLRCVQNTHGFEDYCAKHLEWHPACTLTDAEKAKQKAEKSYNSFE